MEKIFKASIVIAVVFMVLLCAISRPLPLAAAESLAEGLRTAQAAPGNVTFTVKYDKAQVEEVRLKFDGKDKPQFITCEAGKSYVADTSKYDSATLSIGTKTGWRINSILVNGKDEGYFASVDFREINKPGKPAQYTIEIIFRKE
jgi:hypothetical protein